MSLPPAFVRSWGAGPTLLCLHGLGGGAHFFSGIGPALADRWRVAAVDLPGSGFDRSHGAFSFDESAASIVEWIRRDGAGRVCLLGHSLGTIVALEVIRSAPELVSGFIAVGGLPEARPDARARIAARRDHVCHHGLAGLGDGVASANMSRRTCRERPEIVGLFSRLFELQDASAYASMADALVRWTARPLPALESVPCLVVTGDEDAYAPPDAERAFAATLPAGTPVEILSDCGHLPFLERPDSCTALLARTLDAWKVAITRQ
jgi:pimeloyl-ACP methyl ester carboxylesterase